MRQAGGRVEAQLQKCSDEAFKKGVTSVDAIDVGRSAQGLSSQNLPHQLA